MTNSIADIRSGIAEARREAIANGIAEPRVVLVPTMGALHDGHLALVDRAAELGDIVVVSIFVNPLQFGPKEDLSSYPRTLESDVARLADRGVTLVFSPSGDDMYPDGDVSVRVRAGDIGTRYEGRTRPGHFDGVLTVVAKLFHILRPDAAVFGEKDGQQLFLVQRMARDLSFDVEVHGVETVRADDGLALSSRNVYLDDAERRSARVLPAALDAAAAAGDRGIDAVVAAAQSVIVGEPRVELDYLAVVDPATFLPVDGDHHGKAVVLIAARVGTTRLIDNRRIFVN
ncbi:pantoate--beta-alanine ligase [Mycetocola sp. CAN_C7]|uniref:pantoate--beta-alanine ligase n=1 Tax=Mycetocola sp. CAN_C7 TaxID=2787724 RepID=UPI0018CA8D83